MDVDTDKGEFVFRFVGIIRYRSRLFYCLPKYRADDSIIGQRFNGESAAHQAALHHFSTLLNVVRKCKNKAYEDNADREPETEDGLPVLMVRLVTDYAESGLYRDDAQVDELYLAQRTCPLAKLPGEFMHDAVSSSQESAVALRQFYRS